MNVALKSRLQILQDDVDKNVPDCAVAYPCEMAYQKFDKIADLASRRSKILVIGRDYGNQRDLDPSKPMPTDTRIDKVLKDACYDLSKVGFVNAWPVLRKDDSKKCGDHPMHKHKGFTAICRERIKEICRLLDIKIAIILGTGPAKFVADLIGTDANLYEHKEPFVHDGVVYVVISHPGYPNRARREKILGCTEQSLLKAAYRKARLFHLAP